MRRNLPSIIHATMPRRILAMLVSLCCLANAAAFAQEAPPMRVSTLLESDPATIIAEQVMTEAYRRLGIGMVTHRMPGERALVSANEGTVDGELYRKLGMEKIYPNLIIVPVPLQTYEVVVFTRGTSFEVNGWESLRPFITGFVRGIKIIEQNTQGMHIEPATTMRQAFQMLAARRTDLVAGNRASGLAVIKDLQLTDVTILTPPLASFPVFHYLHRKHESLVPKLTAVLQQMQKDQTIEKIQKAVIAAP